MIKLVWRNLTRNKRRTVLTLLSLAFALIVLTCLGAFADALGGAQKSVDTRLVVRSAVSLAMNLPESYGQRLRGLEHVRALTPLNWFNGVYKEPSPANSFPRFAADPATLFEVYPELRLDPAARAAWEGERTAFIAGKTLADQQGWKVGDQIFLRGDLYPTDLTLTLRGVYTSPDRPSMEKQIYFHRRYLEESLGNPGLVSTYILMIDSPDHAAGVMRAADALFATAEQQVRSETEEQFQVAFFSLLGNVRLLFTAIGLALVASVFFINTTTMAMAARERTREVAILKTLGFPPGRTLILVLAESVLLGVAGALLGGWLSSLLLGAAAGALDKTFPILGTISMSPRAWGVALLAGLAIGLVAGIGPAVVAFRLRIVDGLRRVA
ncbi:MAG TPA: FtsX-like permease family protein [Thermoanaerobaculia bacterium]|nr:FtsX-like permease family protein [Thermoanaerobaculia bacterium]